MNKHLCAILLVLINYLPLNVLGASTTIAIESLDMGELATGRPARINLWFPKGDCVGLKAQQFCLADSAITNKVVIFSHGSMGSAPEYSWIGEQLAAAGLVVVGVNHFGESQVYGEETVNPRSTALLWQRAEDISALVDKLASQPVFQKQLNWSNLIAIGHSAGGQTSAMLAGATFDLKLLTAYCDSEISKGDLSCNYGTNSASAPEAFLKKFSASQKDARVKLLILLDPALGSAAQTQSLRDIKIPTLIVGEKNNDFLIWEQQGLRYANAIPNAKVELLAGQEGHFVFVNACNHSVKVMGVPLCEDRAGVDRGATQQAIAKSAIEFISGYEAAFNNQALDVPAKQYSTSLPIAEIILYTPRWVFGLLAGLVVFGVLQARTRQVKAQVALILPAAMLVLSLSGVLRYVGWQLPALFCWLFGLASITHICAKLMNKGTAMFDSQSGKLIIKGSWIPLLVILGIFLTRYALGVASAMQLPLVQNPYFPASVSLVLGAWSGFFLARGLVFWRVKQNSVKPSAR